MKRILSFISKSIVAFLLFFNANLLSGQQLAFPGAEGFGRFASGGRGGEVYHVTNLNDSGEGSFRDAVSQSNRTVVFDVGGVINIDERIVIQKNITIAGQTAPGGGITIYGNGIALTSSSGNNIIRYIRFRMGQIGDYDKDALAVSGGTDYMVDHVSISWGRDGTLDVNGTGVDNLSFQDCIISQGINYDNHSTGGLMQSGKWSMIRSLYIDNKTRNPKARGKHEFINSVLYNWAENGYIMGDTEGVSECNLIGNYFIYGPSSNSNTHITRTTPTFYVYAQDNWIDSVTEGTIDANLLTDYKTATVVGSPFDYPAMNNIWSAQNALNHIIEKVGASIVRDAVDSLLINQLLSYGTAGAIITTESENGITNNVGTVANGIPPTDTDQDGMPDDWETANGLDLSDPSDRNLIDETGFTMLEVYINSLGSNPEPATITFFGEGNPSQTVELDSTIVPFYAEYDNAKTISADGLPAGIEVDIDTVLKTIALSGAPLQPGTFYYTISTHGGSPDISYLDTLVVTGGKPAVIDWIGPGDSIQTVNLGEAITSITYGWDLAENVDVSGLAPGLTSLVNMTDSTITISGTPAHTGVYDYIVFTTGGIENVERIGAITVESDGTLLTIQENQPGYCSIDGTIDSDNAGYTYLGFSNTENSTGASISYQVVADEGSGFLAVQYANGSSDRPANVIINGTSAVNPLSLPSTGSWTTWGSVLTTIELSEGKNNIILEATSSGGLPNIDYISVTGAGVSAGDCIDIVPDSSRLSSVVYGGGDITPEEGIYKTGTEVTIIAEPGKSWELCQWFGVTSSTGENATVLMDQDREITALFCSILESSDTLIIQENTKGFCSIDGTINSDNSGFTGEGFSNTENALDSGITWAVHVDNPGYYNLFFRYANGLGADRPGKLLADSVEVYPWISLPSTGNWESWENTPRYSVHLDKGGHFIELESTTGNGLANIDYLAIIGAGASEILCDSVGVEPEDTSSVPVVDYPSINNELKVYPSPATEGYFYIDLSDLEIQEYNISVYNILGKLEYVKKVESNQKVKIDNLLNGLYLLNVSGTNYNKNMKIILK